MRVSYVVRGLRLTAPHPHSEVSIASHGMKRLSAGLLSVLLLATACPGYWHSITVPSAASAGVGETAARDQVIGVAERISLAHGLRSRPVASPQCTPHWGMAPADSTGWYQTRGWPDVCVDTTRRGELVVSLDAGERELQRGSLGERLWLALRDSLAQFGGISRGPR
jgi:hypothetical protein